MAWGVRHALNPWLGLACDLERAMNRIVAGIAIPRAVVLGVAVRSQLKEPFLVVSTNLSVYFSNLTKLEWILKND